MPLSEFLKKAGKLGSGQQKMASTTDLSSFPENEFVELVWENGQLMMQGQSSRAKKSNSFKNLIGHAILIGHVLLNSLIICAETIRVLMTSHLVHLLVKMRPKNILMVREMLNLQLLVHLYAPPAVQRGNQAISLITERGMRSQDAEVKMLKKKLLVSKDLVMFAVVRVQREGERQKCIIYQSGGEGTGLTRR